MENSLTQSQLINGLDKYPIYRKFLYRRGYIVTTRNDVLHNQYPFYDYWTYRKINEKYYLYLHQDQKGYIQTVDAYTILLIGHAYNPFQEEIDENLILSHCLRKYAHGKDAFLEYINELTGIFVIFLFDGEEVLTVQDATGMRTCFYGICDNNIYYLSHYELLKDIDHTNANEFVEKLVNSYSFNHFGSKYFPGDLTPIKELSRLGPNLYLITDRHNTFLINRFFPLHIHPEKSVDDDSEFTFIANTLKSTISLCQKKWKKPAISLSGGMDSRTTLSSANGLYDKFYYYSFHSKPQEKLDCTAAHNICESIGLDHRIYPIKEDIIPQEEFQLFRLVVASNCGKDLLPNDSELWKYLFLSTLSDFDVELKSWASEIGRASWEKRYGCSFPNKLPARAFSIFQTRFIYEFNLLKNSDKAYADFLRRSQLINPPYNYEHSDMFYWEYRFGSWGANVVVGQDIFNYEVTMPLNNRILMDRFLWFPHNFRSLDGVNKKIIEINDDRLLKKQDLVKDDYLSSHRVKIEGCYYKLMTLFVGK